MKKLILFLLIIFGASSVDGQIFRSSLFGLFHKRHTVSTIPSLMSATIDDSLKNYIALHYSIPLDNTSIPMTADYRLANNSTHFLIGKLVDKNPVETAASATVVPIGSSASVGSGLASWSFMNVAHRSRVQYNDTMVKVQFYVGDIDPQMTSFNLEVFRGPVLSSMTRITSQNILTLLTPNSVNTITLPTPVAIQQDDKLGFSITSTGNAPTHMLYTVPAVQSGNGSSPTGMYSKLGGTTSIFSWFGQSYNDFFVPIRAITKNGPLIGVLGDSNVEGYPLNSSEVNIDNLGNGLQNNYTYPYPYKLGSLLNTSVINLGISGAPSNVIRDNVGWLIDHHVKIAIIECTINAVVDTDYVHNYTRMIDTLIPYGINVFLSSVQPSAAWGSNALITNHDLDSAARLHGAHFINTYVSLDDGFGNLQVSLRADGNHVNAAGHQIKAQIDADSIGRYTPVEIRGSNVYIKANRKFGSTDKEFITYTPSTNPVRSAIGSNAVGFTADTVHNSIIPAPEDLYYDVTNSFSAGIPNQWSGIWGQSDKQMPRQGASWVGAMPDGGKGSQSSIYLIADSLSAINNFNINAYQSFATLGWTFSGTNHIWPIVNGVISQQNDLTIDTALYYSIYKDGVGFFMASSPDQVTWTKFYEYPFKTTKPAYIWAFSSSYYPAGFKLEPVGSIDNTPPSVIDITVPEPRTVLLETDEKLSTTSTTGWTLKRNGSNALILTSIDELPTRGSLRFLYQFIVSDSLLKTDSITLGYNASVGSVTDTSVQHNVLPTFAQRGATNLIRESSFVFPTAVTASVLTFDFVKSNLHTKSGLLTPLTLADTPGHTPYAEGIDTLYAPGGADADIYFQNHSVNDYVEIRFKPKNGILPLTDSAAGTGYVMVGTNVGSVGNWGLGGGGVFYQGAKGQFYRIHKNDFDQRIQLQISGDGISGWGTVGSTSILGTIGDRDIYIKVGDEYAWYIRAGGYINHR